MAREQEERDLRFARLRQEIQVGLDSGSPRTLSDLDAFLDACAEEAVSELRAKS